MGRGIIDKGQMDAVNSLVSGKILCGGVGSGKSRTALAYYYICECGGSIEPSLRPMKKAMDLTIITTAKKRDTHEWESELAMFNITEKLYGINIVIDSWNNIQKYTLKNHGFFIFDEQRLVGNGKWVKSFYKIARTNHWLILSATPGDTWKDYIPAFVANGFYKNQTAFNKEHAVYSRYCTAYPKIERYVGENKLNALRDSLLVDIDCKRHTQRHVQYIKVPYNEELYKRTMKTRWDEFNDEPIQDAARLCYTLRKIVNYNDARVDAVYELYKLHPKLIIFYNFDYELDLLRAMCIKHKLNKGEWNGHKHESIPDTDSWVYLVQYTAGAEGWNCVSTDVIVFFSLNYSYKATEQARGRIDRRNTPFTDLYYFHLVTTAWIDRAIKLALFNKKEFNERRYFKNF